MGDGNAELRLITFRVGPETFVLDIMAVRQIVPYTGSTSLPTAPAFIEGVVVLRNEVIPIVDLRARLYPDLREKAAEPLVLITHSSAGVIGVKVDAVRRIVNVATDALLPPPAIVRGIRGELLIAVVPHRDEVYLLIDIEAILSGDEKRELAHAELAASAAQ
jgi:purine-binding chemotaxis protein CheW